MFQRLSIRVQNLAAVFIAATLPPFARPGTKLDITVYLRRAITREPCEGGLLLMTPLYGADGKIYAQAQGPLVVGGYSVSVNGNTKQFNHPNTASSSLLGQSWSAEFRWIWRGATGSRYCSMTRTSAAPRQ